jgi:hypothetical protein
MKKIVRLTESDLVKLVKRVVNEQMKISQVPGKESVNVNGKTLTSGEKILIHNDDNTNNYYGTIDEIELNDDELMITVNGGLVFGVDIDIAIKRKNEPMFAKTQIDKKCLRVKIQKPFYIDKVYFGKYVHTLNFSGLNNYYMVSDKSNCGG